MAGKRIDPRTIDEQAILEIVSSKNDRIGSLYWVNLCFICDLEPSDR